MVSGKDNPLHDGGNLVASGQLKIFFGYAAGVGKTYAMLEAAHHAKREGIDVVVGYVEPHAKAECPLNKPIEYIWSVLFL